jgi:hypothetical protein
MRKRAGHVRIREEYFSEAPETNNVLILGRVEPFFRGLSEICIIIIHSLIIDPNWKQLAFAL